MATFSKRQEKAAETPETDETVYDALETSLDGNPIDTNPL